MTAFARRQPDQPPSEDTSDQDGSKNARLRLQAFQHQQNARSNQAKEHRHKIGLMMFKSPTDQVNQGCDGQDYAPAQKANEFQEDNQRFFELKFADHPQKLQVEQFDRLQKLFVNSHYEGDRASGNTWNSVSAPIKKPVKNK